MYTNLIVILGSDVFEILNVHNERNINLKFIILVRIRQSGFSDDCKSEKWRNTVYYNFLNELSSQIRLNLKMAKIFRSLWTFEISSTWEAWRLPGAMRKVA